MNKTNAAVTKKETLEALRSPGELYVIMSKATKLPFISCDQETYDDQIFLYYREEDAKEKAVVLEKENYPVAVARVEPRALPMFYMSLYSYGVNCLNVNDGTDLQISVQLEELAARKDPSTLPEGKKIVENPALHLTAAYLMQELRRKQPVKPSDEMKQLQEEMLAHYMKGSYILAVQEDGKVPTLKLKDGSIYQPIFTDVLELRKFIKNGKMKTAVIPAAKIPDVLVAEAKGVVINPFGVNVQLQVAKKKPAAEK